MDVNGEGLDDDLPDGSTDPAKPPTTALVEFNEETALEGIIARLSGTASTGRGPVRSVKREVRRFDPLILPQNAVLLKLAQRAMEKITRQVPTPERGRLWTDCDPDFVKTAVYWWWKLAGCKRAQIVGTDPNTGQLRGKWPESLEDIRLIPGRVMGEVYSQSGAARGFIANEDLKYKPPGDEDFVRDEVALDEIPDPFVDIPADPREYLDRPPPAAGYTRVTGAGGRSAADVLMGDPLHGSSGPEPTYAPTL